MERNVWKNAAGYAKYLQCLNCKSTFELKLMPEGCPVCKTDTFLSCLHVVFDYGALRHVFRPESLSGRRRGLIRYREILPLDERAPAISLGEGGTPLVRSRWAEEKSGVSPVYLKDESRNPTWSFKDRLCYVAVCHGASTGARVITVASSGNHGAAAAAYAAKAGIPCVVFTIPNAPRPMVALMRSLGAIVLACKPMDRWALMGHCVKEFGWYPVGNYCSPMSAGNPFGVEGHKTMAYEMFEDLGETPSAVFVPVGRAEGLFGIWKGFWEMEELGWSTAMPRMVAVEPEVGGPLVRAFERGLDTVPELQAGPSQAVSIAGGTGSYQGLYALKNSNGAGVLVSDEEMYQVQDALAREGTFAELSSCASVAAAVKAGREGRLDNEGPWVCMITASGLKDPYALEKLCSQPMPFMSGDVKAFAREFKEACGLDLEEMGQRPGCG